jgi:hypothetical protein
MALVSPGVQVSVIDESFYTPAEPGTVPMIFVASATDKTSSSGTGIAQGTTAANAGKVYLMTSQRELAETFGDPIFKTDANNNPINGGETNEYGLQAAYSYLGVANRAYVVRADVDLGQLEATATAPAANPESGTYWFDTAVSKFGIFEWNSASASTTGGQTFSNKIPHVITSATLLDAGVPKTSFGQAGDYAIVATTDANEMFYKKYDGSWVGVGSTAWVASNPTVLGSTATAGYTGTIGSGTTFTITINGGATTITTSGTTATAVASDISGAGVSGLSARAIGGILAIYYDGSNDQDIQLASGTLDIAVGLGIAVGTYYVPKLTTAPHTSVPAYKTGDAESRPTGSLWVKTTTPNSGAKWSVKKFNGTTKLWEDITAPIYSDAETALYNLDRTGGGLNLAVGNLYIDHDTGSTALEQTILRRESTGSTKITGTVITTGITAGSKTFTIAESVVGQLALNSAVTVSVTPTGAATDADLIAGAINGSGFTNIVASVDASNRVSIEHNDGGEFEIVDTSGTLGEAGFTGYNYVTKAGTANLYTTSTGFRASNWKILSYTASATAVTTTAADGQLWYSSIVDQVDIMYHNGTIWKGYSAVSSSDPAGPQVKSTAPTTQSDGTALVEGDLWISTADLENYPTIYKWNATSLKWILVDKTDQTTENGILFADARYGTTGGTATVAPTGTIVELLASDFLDTDAPDPALYPKGMLLWNTRRSGFNVKKFTRNYVDVTANNTRGSDSGSSMAAYYPHRWTTESANQVDGSGSFGRIAQKKVVVQSLQAMLNSNQEIRDDESRLFNIMATPGYPELIGEMISLNNDRGLSAFIVGDSPMRLTPDATSLQNWASNVNLAVEDNDNGLVSTDEYLGVFYPSGFTSDNFGNNVVVPSSHMMLRTIALSDQVSFPWFAPAGTRRGGITNASSTGYINNEGEFVSTALNEGQRDTLYSNNVNPITFITGAGLVNYGQKTRFAGSSALDRINVARLVIYMRSQLNKLARPYVFEPNDKITRDEIKAQAESLLLELVGNRAIYDFLVVCDESNNTPTRIDRNELYLDIAIEPVKAVEFIYVPLRLKNTGEIAGL